MTVHEQDAAAPRPLFGLGSILLAGFIGGPPAAGVLLFNIMRHGGSKRTRFIVSTFVVVTSLAWFWCTSRVPPDLISHLFIHVPFWIIWSVLAGLLLKPLHVAHRAEGGTFGSAGRAAWIAIQINIGLLLVALTVGWILSRG